MSDLGPNKKRIAQLLRMLSSSGGERRNAFALLERAMQSDGVTWTDIGDGFEHDDGKYTENEMLEFAQAARAEGVEAGIKIGTSNGKSNGHLSLPKPAEMAEYCPDRLSQMKDGKQRDFINDMYRLTQFTQRGGNLSLSRLGYLASIYIQIGGKT